MLGDLQGIGVYEAFKYFEINFFSQENLSKPGIKCKNNF
jgi:hypothetical protein